MILAGRWQASPGYRSWPLPVGPAWVASLVRAGWLAWRGREGRRPGGPRPRVHAKARGREVPMREGQLWAAAPILRPGPDARVLGRGDSRALRYLG